MTRKVIAYIKLIMKYRKLQTKLLKLLKISKITKIIYLQKLSFRSSISFLISAGLSNLFGPGN